MISAVIKKILSAFGIKKEPLTKAILMYSDYDEVVIEGVFDKKEMTFKIRSGKIKTKSCAAALLFMEGAAYEVRYVNYLLHDMLTVFRLNEVSKSYYPPNPAANEA